MNCEIIMQRNLNEEWGCDQETGEMDIADYLGDGGSSEFSNYYCEEHEEYFDTWHEAKTHGMQVIA